MPRPHKTMEQCHEWFDWLTQLLIYLQFTGYIVSLNSSKVPLRKLRALFPRGNWIRGMGDRDSPSLQSHEFSGSLCLDKLVYIPSRPCPFLWGNARKCLWYKLSNSWLSWLAWKSVFLLCLPTPHHCRFREHHFFKNSKGTLHLVVNFVWMIWFLSDRKLQADQLVLPLREGWKVLKYGSMTGFWSPWLKFEIQVVRQMEWFMPPSENGGDLHLTSYSQDPI